ncbi:hypothetical protein MKX01_037178 [Papaver californicum]|nr:hypothetical protein MKX01_037178 [Papaver californicum]
MQSMTLMDGSLVNDTLVIKAQVQVIRCEKRDRLFRSLDCVYRRELARIYLANMENNCGSFVEERRKKLGDLLEEDSARWSSFCAFWLGVDQNVRLRMSREKTDKEVTSTLVMDSLYSSGLKALECHSKRNTAGEKVMDAAASPAPIVRLADGMFTLVDDVSILIERAALEDLPPKDEKGPQNRQDAYDIERDERRLAELGRRTGNYCLNSYIQLRHYIYLAVIGILSPTHYFISFYSNRIEVAYKEAVALKRQEELIREEEETWQAESEQKVNGGAADRKKHVEKKQSKQKHNSGKGKDEGGSENLDLQDKMQSESTLHSAMDCLSLKQAPSVLEKPDTLGDVDEGSGCRQNPTS